MLNGFPSFRNGWKIINRKLHSIICGSLLIASSLTVDEHAIEEFCLPFQDSIFIMLPSALSSGMTVELFGL